MKLTRRLQKIKERLFNEDFKDKGTWYLKGDTILTNSEIREEPLIVRKAKAIEYIAENLPAFIKEDELIVGNPNLNSVACGIVLPVYATEEELEKARLHALDQNLCGAIIRQNGMRFSIEGWRQSRMISTELSDGSI